LISASGPADSRCPKAVLAYTQRVVESLRGDWAEERLFALAQAIQSWDHYQGLIAACDRQIEVVVRQMPDAKAPPSARVTTETFATMVSLVATGGLKPGGGPTRDEREKGFYDILFRGELPDGRRAVHRGTDSGLWHGCSQHRDCDRSALS
jgi:hypothetical protein